MTTHTGDTETLPGSGNTIETAPGLTDQQKQEVREIFARAVREYWTEDDIRELARNESNAEFHNALKNDVSAMVTGLVKHNPEAIMNQLFRQGGMVVRTKSSEYFDGIVGELMRDEESGIPEAIRQHVRDNLPTLIQNAISVIVAGMVTNFIAKNADSLAQASRDMINQAFQNASLRTY